MRMVLACTAAIVLGAGLASGSDGVQLVRDGEPAATIVAPSDGPPAYAAGVLRQYVRRMSGATLPIENDPDAAEGTVVGFRVEEGAAALDGFHARADGDRIIVAASVPRGCIYGAFELLKRCGCRFYGREPLGVIVPERGSISLPADLDVLREPDYENRLPCLGSPEEQVRWGLNHTHAGGSESHRKLVKMLGMKTWRWGHIWPRLLERRYYPDGRTEPMSFDDKQDWLPADENGNRRSNERTLCFSNPDALEWFTDNAAGWVLANYRDADLVNMWPADRRSLALCRCEECRERGWTPTDWYLHIHNKVWRKLKERDWPGSFGWIAYHGSEEPPEHVDLAENGRDMDFLYAPRPRGASQHGPFTNDHPTNVRYRKNLDAWRKYLREQNFQGRRTVFEYYFDQVLLGPLATGRTFLVPRHDDMQAEMEFYLEKGFNGFFDCSPPSDILWPSPLSRWLYQQLMWDVDLDVQAARRDFFAHYYGPAAGAAGQVRTRVEKLMYGEPSEEAVEQLRGLTDELDDDISGAGAQSVLGRRLRGLKLWVRFCAMCKQSQRHRRVTHDTEKGRATEQDIRQFLVDNGDFLVENGFMARGGLNYIKGTVVDRHLRAFRAMGR